MVCDCMRITPRDPHADSLSQTVKNRVYYGPHAAFRLAYFQWFGQLHAPRGSLDVERALGAATHPEPARLPCPPGFGSDHSA